MDNKEEILKVERQFGIFGRSPLLLEAINTALQAAPYDVSVLITGENGVGKEVYHKILHQYSRRRSGKCIAVNCGGLPEGTIDSELFGHVKGAYTGAVSDRKGYFEEADGGTIFLDEVGELPPATQARLLRILESGEYYRMGSSEVRKTDVRIVAATNVDLQKAIRKGTFREDLYYRLATITIRVPSLRERPEDIYPMFRMFANEVAAQYQMPPVSLTDDARRKLLAYSWPGNVRQMKHVVEEISIVEGAREIDAETLMKHLPVFDEHVILSDETTDESQTFHTGEKQMIYQMIFKLSNELEEMRKKLGMGNGNSTVHNPATRALPTGAGGIKTGYMPDVTATRKEDNIEDVEVEEIAASYADYHTEETPQVRPLAEVEKDAIRQALEHNHGNKRQAAIDLGISERTIHRKIQEYNL